ncbi:MAG: hypothetical protein KGI71_05910 [Patescibacteria group bacterium]|nr:hypothetical protein [Patescibacteria group bacterium]
MAKLMIDISGLAGLAPKFFGDANTGQGVGITGTPSRRYIGSKGQLASGYWNPLRVVGYMAPPTSMKNSSVAIAYGDVTYKQNSELVAMLYNSGSVWAASKNTVFYQNSGGNGFSFNTAQNLSTNTPQITDMQIYPVNGVNKILVAYKQTAGSHGDIMLINTNLIGTNTTWFSTTAGGGGTYLGALNDIVLVPGSDGFLYILDGSYVHRLDGSVASGGVNGTVTQGVLVAKGANTTGVPGNQYVDAIDYGGNLWIVEQSVFNPSVSGSGTSINERYIAITVWNRLVSTSATTSTIPIVGMQSVKKIYMTADGDLRIIGISTNRTVQIRRYNGTTFEIMQELPIWSTPPYRDSCTFFEGIFTWMGNDGKVYAHGKLPALVSGTLSSSVNYTADQTFILGDMSSLPNTDFTPGAIIAYGAGTAGTFSNQPTSLPAIIFSYATGSTYKTYQWFIHGTGNIASIAQTADLGNAITLVQRLPGLANVNYLRVYCLPQGAGGSTQLGTLSIYKNQSATALNGGAISITQTDVQRGYTYIPMGSKGSGTFALQFGVSWPTNVTLNDATDWLPYAIEVDYDEDTKLK